MKKIVCVVLSLIVVLSTAVYFYHSYTIKELNKVEVIPSYYSEGNSVHSSFTIINNSKYEVILYFKENADDEYGVLTYAGDGEPDGVEAVSSGSSGEFGYMYDAKNKEQAEQDVEELKSSALYVKIKTDNTVFEKEIEKRIK